MQRRLILLRHAKSDWNAESGGDHDRPLNARGRRDVPRIGDEIAALGWTPEAVLSSDAKRTRETWQRMHAHLPGAPEARFSNDLYLAGLGAIAEAAGKLPDDVSTVMLIGHNPGWEEAATILVGREIEMTTCNAALLSLEANSWREALAREGAWTLEHLLRPKER